MPEPTESTQKKSPLHVFDESMRRSLHKKADPAVTGQSYGGQYHSGKVKNSGSAGGNSRNRWQGRWQDRCNHQKNYANAPDSTTAHASPNPSPYALDTTPGLR